MPIEIKDVAGLSEPIKKLIEVISLGAGKISEPYLIRKKADAKVYEIKEITKAIIESQGILKKINYDSGNIEIQSLESIEEIKKLESNVAGRSLLRNAHTEAVKQVNIETISQIAYEQIKDETIISGEKVDDNWIHRFFDIAGEISDEEMQILWGRVLSGEIKQPKSYSLRTLEFLRNISKHEAQTFSKYAKIAIWVGSDALIFNPSDKDFLIKNFDINFTDNLLMEEIGILNSQPNLSLNFSTVSNDINQNIVFISGEKCLIIERQKECPAHTIPVLKFTKIGMDLLRLVPQEAPDLYFDKLASALKSEKSIIKLGKIITKNTNGTINYKEIKKY